MTPLRHLIMRRRWLALWLVGLALLMRMAVPAGYMPTVSGQSIAIGLCSGSGPSTTIFVIPGSADHQDKKGEHGRKQMPCGFSGLSAPSLAGADADLLALAIAFIVATVFLSVPPNRIALPSYLRPPLRGPPTKA